MDASFLDLRRKMRDVLKALDRNEAVTITYRGKKRAVMLPVGAVADDAVKFDPAAHPAFGMWRDRTDLEDVDAVVRKLRQPRYRDL